jgi:hypothetical protein
VTDIDWSGLCDKLMAAEGPSGDLDEEVLTAFGWRWYAWEDECSQYTPGARWAPGLDCYMGLNKAFIPNDAQLLAMAKEQADVLEAEWDGEPLSVDEYLEEAGDDLYLIPSVTLDLQRAWIEFETNFPGWDWQTGKYTDPCGATRYQGTLLSLGHPGLVVGPVLANGPALALWAAACKCRAECKL